jgi:SAM-dependent methyltransferase
VTPMGRANRQGRNPSPPPVLSFERGCPNTALAPGRHDLPPNAGTGASSAADVQNWAVDPKEIVADGYDRLHNVYADWTAAGHDGLRRHYIDRIVGAGLITAGSAVVDLGCGTGRHATAYLVDQGLDVTGVDLSPKSVEVANREVPGGRFLVGDMASIDLPAASFDLVTAFYSLIHVPKEQQAEVLVRVWSWVRPGGYLVVAMGGGTQAGDDIEPAWLGVAPMFWSNWDVPTSRRIVREAGFEEIEANLEAVHEDGRKVVFLWVVARKPGATVGPDV